MSRFLWELSPGSTSITGSTFFALPIRLGFLYGAYISFAIPLKGRILPGWELIRPLMVTIERDEDGSFVVTDEVFMVYGTGLTVTLALRDYVNSLVEYYQIIEAKVRNGHQPDEPGFVHLSAYLHPTAERYEPYASETSGDREFALDEVRLSSIENTWDRSQVV